MNQQALQVFSRSFPLEYPEIEALVVLQRKQFRFEEVPCQVRPRQAGVSTISPMKSVYYLIHVLLGVFVNVLRWDGRRKHQPLPSPPNVKLSTTASREPGKEAATHLWTE